MSASALVIRVISLQHLIHGKLAEQRLQYTRTRSIFDCPVMSGCTRIPGTSALNSRDCHMAIHAARGLPPNQQNKVSVFCDRNGMEPTQSFLRCLG
jgi:hypothetical protein